MTHTHPVPDVEETLLIGQVEHQQEAHGVSEESCSEAAKPESIKQLSLCSIRLPMCRFLGMLAIGWRVCPLIVGWIAMTFCKNIHCPQKLNLAVFGDHLSSLLLQTG